MQSSTSYFLRRTSQLGRYSWRNRRSVIYKPLQEFTCSALLTCLTVVYQMQKLFAPYKTWLGWTSVCTSILTLDQMILRLSSIPLDFWYPHVVAGIFFSTTLLWLLVVLEEKTKGLASTISRLVSKRWSRRWILFCLLSVLFLLLFFFVVFV